MNDLLSNTKRLQHHLIDKVTKAQVNILLDKESGKDSTRLRSLQGKGAGCLLNAILSTHAESRNFTWKCPLGGIHEVGDGDALACLCWQMSTNVNVEK